jgi:hypothetical protein
VVCLTAIHPCGERAAYRAIATKIDIEPWKTVAIPQGFPIGGVGNGVA